MKVNIIMKDVIAVEANTTLGEAAKVMAQNSISCVLVSENGAITGILTERDIAREVAEEVLYLDRTVDQLMCTNLLTIDANENLTAAAKMMQENRIKKLPVTVNGKIEGIITSTDLLEQAIRFNAFKVLD